MKVDHDSVTRKFILSEGRPDTEKSILSYLQALRETLESLNPKSQTDYRRIEIAKEHVREARRQARRLQEKVYLLEEQVKVLEEGK